MAHVGNASTIFLLTLVPSLKVLDRNTHTIKHCILGVSSLRVKAVRKKS